MKNNRTVYFIVLMLGVLIMLNILGERFFFRLDFTEDNRYTLSEATENILENIDDPVTITVYFSEDLPPNFMRVRQEFKDLLIEYSNLSHGNIVYEFINPNEDEETEKQAMQEGVSPVLINSREKNKAVQKKAFLGAVLKKGEQKEIIPMIRPGAAMEYSLSSSIKKISVVDKPLVGFVSGHGEAQTMEMMQVVNSLEVLYDVEQVNLNDTVNLNKYKALAVVAPKDSLPPRHINIIRNYIKNGNNVFFALNRVDGKLNQNPPMGSTVSTGIEGMLQDFGIKIENSFLVDARCANINVRQQQGTFTYSSNVSFPYLPRISNFTDHPISKGLEQVVFKFVSPVSFFGDTSNKFIPLAQSSNKSGTQSPPLYFDVSKRWMEKDFPKKNLTVAAALELNNTNSKLVVIGDGDFAIGGQRGRQVAKDNLNLMVNSIDWLADDTGLTELRNKGVTARPLDDLEDGTKSFLKYLNFLLPLILIIIYGIFRMQFKRILRIKRMRKDYV